jgi:type II secretory pathway pseudopilin PulG
MRQIKGNQGTSLVEVLVVMVVLLVGILTVVRLFPPGFKSVKHAESMTFAGRLAQYEIERWKNNAANLPDGVLPIGMVNGSLAVLNDQFPGPPITDKNDDTGAPIDNNATTFRRIIGETTRIPFGGWSTGPTAGSLYILAFSPVDISTNFFAVRGGSLSRRIIDSEAPGEPWRYLRPYQYGVDYGQQGERPKFCFRATGEPRVYYLSCSWWEKGTSDPVLHTVTSLEVNVPANTEGWVSLDTILTDNGMTVPANFMGINHYSDTMSRGFVRVDSGAAWSSDPYEYKLLDPILGVISFNPLGYTQQEFGQALQARIDYDILDMQIIHEDKRVPSNAPLSVTLTLNHIKQIEQSMELDGSLYQGICPDKGIMQDILAIDLGTGMGVKIDDSWDVNYKDGIVKLPIDGNITLYESDNPSSTTVVPSAGRNIRFLYKAEGDWSLQFHKAHSQYERNDGSVLTYKDYAVDPDNFRRLWFSACNANNSISVQYEYDDNGETRRIVECLKATDALEEKEFVSGVKKNYTFIDLSQKPTRIISVNGVSARARVIWREGERWRHVDLDTILPKQSAQ